VRAVATALLIGAVLAGCGGDNGTDAENAYVGAVNAAQDRFVRGEAAVQQSITTATSTPRQDRATLDRFAAVVARALTELKAIAPPASVRALHGKLVAALAGYQRVIAEHRAATRSGDPRVLIAARTRFSTDAEAVNTRVQQVITQINAKLAK